MDVTFILYYYRIILSQIKFKEEEYLWIKCFEFEWARESRYQNATCARCFPEMNCPLQTRAGRSQTFWTRGLALRGLAGTCRLTSPVLRLLNCGHTHMKILAISAYRQSPISAFRQKGHIGTPLFSTQALHLSEGMYL